MAARLFLSRWLKQGLRTSIRTSFSSIHTSPHLPFSAIAPLQSAPLFRAQYIGFQKRNSSSDASSPAQELTLTDNCIKRLQQIVKEGSDGEQKMLRIGVEGGGCSGFQYLFSLDDKIKPDDKVFQKDGVKVVVDEVSFTFLKGATVDFVEELIRSAFMVTGNPNASGGCSCGSSFVAK